MTTNQTFWQPEDRQVRGVTHFREWLRDHVRDVTGDVLRAFYPLSGILEEQWPVSYAAGLLTVDHTATRLAIVQDSTGRCRLLAPTPAAGVDWWTLLAGWAGFDKVYFPDVAATPYYLGMKYGTMPVRARQLAEPDVSGGSAVFKYDAYQERIGQGASPSAKDTSVPGQITLTVPASVAGPTWVGVGTRPCIVYLDNPVTASSEAIYSGLCGVSGGAVKITVPHLLGQTQAQADASVAADYTVFVPGPLVTLVDPSADSTVVYLGVCNTGVLDLTGQNIVLKASGLTDALRYLQALQTGIREGVWNPREGNQKAVGQFFGGTNAEQWNNCGTVVGAPGPGSDLSVVGPEVKVNFLGGNPFALVDNAFVQVGVAGSQVLCTEADAAVNWADYRYTPPGAATYCICLTSVDATNEVTPRYRATLSTYAGTAAAAATAGYLPLIQYAWNGAAITSQTPVRLSEYRGVNSHRMLGGQDIGLAGSSTDGEFYLQGTDNDSKGAVKEYILADWETVSATKVAFERLYRLVAGQGLHVLKIAAQANAAAHATDAGASMLQLGGLSDLGLVGRKTDPGDGLGARRRIGFSEAGSPVAGVAGEHCYVDELGGNGYDQCPTGSGNKSRLKVGDLHLIGTGKVDWRMIPLGNVGDGWRYRLAGPANVLGPWCYGALDIPGAAALTDPGNWWWVNHADECALVDCEKPLYIELPFRGYDYLWDLCLTGSNGNDAGDAVLTWELVRLADDGTETQWIVSIGGANNDWLTADIAEQRFASAAGKPGAAHPNVGAPLWVPATHAFALGMDYRYFVKVTPTVPTTWNKISFRAARCAFLRKEI